MSAEREASTIESPTMEAPPVEPETADTPAVRRPLGSLAPALDSVRWGPDRRDPDETDTFEALDALARAHFGRPARVAGRLRARHNRERISLALVVTLDQESFDEAMNPDAVVGFGRQDDPAPEARPEVERREPTAQAGERCLCEGELAPVLHLMRVVHGSTPEVASVEVSTICTGIAFDARLADLDGDGRVEARFDVRYTTDVSCSVRGMERKRMVVVDVADLATQIDIVLEERETEYFGERERFTRARFLDLDEDGDKDLEIRGRSVQEGDSDSHDYEERFAIDERYLYDPTTDRWVHAP